MIANLKKIHAIGFNSVNDKDGVLGRVVVLADLDQIDFNKIFPKETAKIDIKNRKSTFY
jgi:hypothetical protein